MTRIATFINQTGRSNKIYHIDREGKTVITRWGRIGRKLQTKRVSFDSMWDVEGYVEDVCLTRQRHGYTDITY